MNTSLRPSQSAPAAALLPVLLWWLLLSAALGAQETAAPTIEELLAKHYQALGGLDRLAAVETLETTGSINLSGLVLPVRRLQKRPDRIREEVEIQGTQRVQAWDGREAWQVSPLEGLEKPAAMSEAAAASLRRQSDIDGPLVGFRRMGWRLELAGREPLGDSDTWKILITEGDGATQTVYLGATDFLIKRWIVRSFAEGMGELDITVDMREYGTFDGVVRPVKQSVTTPMATIEGQFSYRAGVAVDDAVFSLPGQQANPALDLAAILERHRAARRPADPSGITTVRATGKVRFQGFELPMTMSFARPGSFRVDIQLPGMAMVMAFDGKTAWMVSPMQGVTEPEALAPEAEDAVAVFSDFLWGLLIDAEARGTDLTLAGIEPVGRHQTYAIDARLASGKARRVFLGGEDFLEHQIELDAEFLGAQRISARLDDYQIDGGLVVPRAITIATTPMQIEMRIEAVETNTPIDPAIFALPPPPPAPASPPGR